MKETNAEMGNQNQTVTSGKIKANMKNISTLNYKVIC